MPYFNKVQIENGVVSFGKTPSSKWAGCSLLMLQEMAHIMTNRTTPLDIGFWYFVMSRSASTATIGCRYDPPELSKYYLGACLRVADDALKCALNELVRIRQAQQLIDSVDTAGNYHKQFTGGVSELRILPKCIIGVKSGHRFLITDVHFKLEYKTPETICERVYLEWLEKKWIPKLSKAKDHPFRKLKEALIAQAFANFVVIEHKLKLPVSDYQPIFYNDDCQAILFPETALLQEVYASLDTMYWVSRQGGVFIRKCKDEYNVEVIECASKHPTLQLTSRFVTMQPEAPDGGVMLKANPVWQESRDTRMKSVLFKQEPDFVTREPANAKLIRDLLSSTCYAGFLVSPPVEEKHVPPPVEEKHVPHAHPPKSHPFQLQPKAIKVSKITDFVMLDVPVARTNSVLSNKHYPTGYRKNVNIEFVDGEANYKLCRSPEGSLVVNVDQVRVKLANGRLALTGKFTSQTFPNFLSHMQDVAKSHKVSDFILDTTFDNVRLRKWTHRNFEFIGQGNEIMSERFVVGLDRKGPPTLYQYDASNPSVLEGIWKRTKEGAMKFSQWDPGNALRDGSKLMNAIAISLDVRSLLEAIEFSYDTGEWDHAKKEALRISAGLIGGQLGGTAGSVICGVAGKAPVAKAVPQNVKVLVTFGCGVYGSYKGYGWLGEKTTEFYDKMAKMVFFNSKHQYELKE